MISSIDVFDTVLTRLVGLPDSLFILLGNRLRKAGLLAISAEVFARSRSTAERLSRRNVPNGEPTLAEIYGTLRWMLGIPAELADRLRLEELLIEAELMRAMPGASEMISNLQSAADSLVFCSDMYLPSAFLKGQLARLVEVPEKFELMVSCEQRASKVSGALFRHLLREKGTRPEDVLHVGNDASADGAVPARLGLRTKLLEQASLNRYEIILENHRWETGGLTSLLAGASRMARLTVPARDAREGVIRDVAAGVAAPVLVGYCLWLLRRAEELNLKRLYFVSRDGELLLEISARLAEGLGINLDLRYLYGSRQAWHLPAFGLSNRPEDKWLLTEARGHSVETVLAKVGLHQADLQQTLAKYGFHAASAESLNDDSLERLRQALADPAIRARIAERASQARTPMLGYLRQEGLMDPTPVGIVDLGWTGQMFDSLWAVLRSWRAESPYGFLFGWSPAEGCNDGMLKEGYLFDGALRQGYDYLTSGTVALLETFCAARHGMVCGYCEDEHATKPILKETLNQAALAWGIPTLRKTVNAFIDNLALVDRETFLAMDCRMAAQDLLRALGTKPSGREASVWGAYGHFRIQTEAHGYPIAMPFSARHIVNRFMGKPIRPGGPDWYEGSLRLTPVIIRCGLRLADRIRRLARILMTSLQGLGLLRWAGRYASGERI